MIIAKMKLKKTLIEIILKMAGGKIRELEVFNTKIEKMSCKVHPTYDIFPIYQSCEKYMANLFTNY